MSFPVATQPQKMEMSQAPGMAGLPQSLQYLAGLDQIIIKQKIEALEVLTGFETRNRYAVLDNKGQQIFFVQEESSLFERIWFPKIRGFQLHVTDNNSVEVMQFSREFKCSNGCCWCGEGCCSITINIESPVGKMIGRVKTGNSKWKHHFQIFDAADNHLFTIWGPCCPCQAVCCPDDIDFPIMDPSLQTRVGNIAKQWRGCCAESFTNADQYCLTFPANMTVDCKALLMGSVFIVEYLVFERQTRNN